MPTADFNAAWKLAQGMTQKPVKFGTITAELLAFSAHDRHYTDSRDRIMALPRTTRILQAEVQS